MRAHGYASDPLGAAHVTGTCQRRLRPREQHTNSAPARPQRRAHSRECARGVGEVALATRGLARACPGEKALGAGRRYCVLLFLRKEECFLSAGVADRLYFLQMA